MKPFGLFAGLVASMCVVLGAPKLPGIEKAMETLIEKKEIAGAVTAVVSKDRVLHMEGTGFADVAAQREMTPETIFWIASMTKPVTAVAVMMLYDEGKLKPSDPVSKFIPEFAELKTPSGKPANLTITQILTHTSGLGEAPREEAKNARTLKDLVPMWVAAKMQFEPGEKWSYCQSGINAAGRIVEMVSGMSFDEFLEKRLFQPLGMKDTTFYPTEEQNKRMVTAYAKKKETGELEAVAPRDDFGSKDHPPQGNGGLFSTARDYARFGQMLLNGGALNGKRYLSAEALKFINTPQTGDMPVGFFQNETWGNRGNNYGWGLGTCVLKEPHEGVAEVLSPGTYGHGGAWGTQAWIDPVKGVAYVLMVQRSNFPNSDASEVRRVFQKAASEALGNKAAGNTEETFEMRVVSKTAGDDFTQMELTHSSGEKEVLNVAKKPVLTSKAIKSASVGKDSVSGNALINLEFTEAGAKKFADVTERNEGERLAIIITGEVMSAPVIQTRIIGGRAQIAGNFTEEEARELAREIQTAAGR